MQHCLASHWLFYARVWMALFTYITAVVITVGYAEMGHAFRKVI